MNLAKKSITILATLALIIAITTTAHALDYSISQHTINIQINPDTKDAVTEKFFITFPNETEKISFRENSMKLGTSIDEWKKLNERFIPSMGENVLNKKIAYNEGTQSYLQISYELAEPLMAKGKEATMMTEYSIKVNYFNSFYEAGLWIIPENSIISIELPPGAEVKNTTEPDAQTATNGTRKVISWEGYKSANKLSLSYVLWKKITPVIDLNQITNFLFKTQLGIILLIIAVIIIAAIVWQRKKIGETVEEFVETHSVIKEE